MADFVTNKLVFALAHRERVKNAMYADGYFDFERLIPPPLHMYRGNVGVEEKDDFPVNWLSWSKKHWGTKWNAGNCTEGASETEAFIQFKSAWAPPFPVIVAFANLLRIRFEHRYAHDIADVLWGIETWDVEDGVMSRVIKRRNLLEDKDTLYAEFGIKCIG